MTDSQDQIPECPLAPAPCPVAEACRRLEEENKRLLALARIDELTGYYNFRHLRHALGAEMERTRRTGLETGVIIADLDHFKKVNDRYGHEAGNLVLRRVTGLWLDGIRQMDIACRYGGEEFVFILPGTRLQATAGAAERLRRTLGETDIQVNGHTLRLTASFGVDSYGIDDQLLSTDALLDRVDRHLLSAKSKGRNQVCFDRTRVLRAPTEVTEAERNSLFSRSES